MTETEDQPMSEGAQTRAIKVTVNGRVYERTIETRLLLSDFLRHELELTGTHVGCEHGVCGACTVLVGGRSARACLMFAVQTHGREILTIEGIARGDDMHPLQTAFSDQHGLQCGFCTPGMLTTLIELLRDNPDPSEEDIRDAISGNLCRCTGYDGIVKATLQAAEVLRKEGQRA
jgi:aerobic carbon-monoxide dehydrogenase small subunit